MSKKISRNPQVPVLTQHEIGWGGLLTAVFFHLLGCCRDPVREHQAIVGCHRSSLIRCAQKIPVFTAMKFLGGQNCKTSFSLCCCCHLCCCSDGYFSISLLCLLQPILFYVTLYLAMDAFSLWLGFILLPRLSCSAAFLQFSTQIVSVPVKQGL